MTVPFAPTATYWPPLRSMPSRTLGGVTKSFVKVVAVSSRSTSNVPDRRFDELPLLSVIHTSNVYLPTWSMETLNAPLPVPLVIPLSPGVGTVRSAPPLLTIRSEVMSPPASEKSIVPKIATVRWDPVDRCRRVPQVGDCRRVIGRCWRHHRERPGQTVRLLALAVDRPQFEGVVATCDSETTKPPVATPLFTPARPGVGTVRSAPPLLTIRSAAMSPPASVKSIVASIVAVPFASWTAEVGAYLRFAMVGGWSVTSNVPTAIRRASLAVDRPDFEGVLAHLLDRYDEGRRNRAAPEPVQLRRRHGQVGAATAGHPEGAMSAPVSLKSTVPLTVAVPPGTWTAVAGEYRRFEIEGA